MSVIQQHQLVFSCSVFLTQFFLTQIFTFISHYFFVWLISFLYLRFWSNLLLQMTILLCVMFFLRSLLFASLFHHILSHCLRFQPSLLLQAVIQSHAAFLRKIFCLHSQIFNSEAQISLAFVYNMWEWILQISLVKTQ